MSALGSVSTSTTLKLSPRLFHFDAIAECEGKDDDDHRLFLVTNELNHVAVLNQLVKVKQRGDLILSNSGMMTLNVFVARERVSPIDVLVVDCSLRVERFWCSFKALILAHTKRETFYKALLEHMQENGPIYYGSESRTEKCLAIQLSDFSKEIYSSANWICLENGYNRVRRLFEEGRFHFKRADWASLSTTHAIALGIMRGGYIVDTLIQNNIAEYCEYKGVDVFNNYRSGMDHITLPTTLIIKTQTRCSCDGEELVQELVERGESAIEQVFESSLLCPHVQKGKMVDRATLETASMMLDVYHHPVDFSYSIDAVAGAGTGIGIGVGSGTGACVEFMPAKASTTDTR